MSIISKVPHEIGHHFEDAHSEFDACKIGMWLFLAQEVLFFGGLFVAYFVFRYMYPNMFIDAHKLLSWKMGAVNTVFLIASSFTMVMSVRASQLGKTKEILNYLYLTLGFATLFMCVKAVEYSQKIHHGLLPARWFSAEGSFDTMHLFYGLYFSMTGVHGLHVLIGMALIIWLILKVKKGLVHEGYFTPVEMVGLYWHLVDLIWIFLFPLLYLVG